MNFSRCARCHMLTATTDFQGGYCTRRSCGQPVQRRFSKGPVPAIKPSEDPVERMLREIEGKR